MTFMRRVELYLSFRQCFYSRRRAVQMVREWRGL